MVKFAAPLSVFVLVLVLSLAVTPFRPSRAAGWNFDVALDAEQTRDLLASPASPVPPAGSWLRVRGMTNARVLDLSSRELDLNPGGPAAAPAPPVSERRAALAALRARGYRIVALLNWDQPRWAGGVRGGGAPLRRLPLDLREAHEHGRRLAATYGDLVDWWEIQNEPDLGFVTDNAETYAAFLKACYLGVQRGRAEFSVTQGRPADALPAGRSRVLMAPLAQPPGPYFEAWARNGGLSYTDGFNYHYYGYAEDFTGAYRQFQDAVNHASAEPSDHASVWSTLVYPSADGWSGQAVASFDFPAEAAADNARRVRERARAGEEPTLEPQGRWWATPGVKVEETPQGWRFTVERRPPGVIRAPLAELPLPTGWSAPGDALLSFSHRLVRAPGDPIEERMSPASDEGHAARSGMFLAMPPSLPTAPAARQPATGSGVGRELPVFLTEYGYGMLDKAAARTPEGRERQRRWFASVAPQIRALGIEGAMAFVLRPYREADLLELGLLTADGTVWTADKVTPALAELMKQGREQLRTRTWRVTTPPPNPVVIDFAAGTGLGQAKNYGGYFLEGTYGRTAPGEGTIVVYNFGAAPVSGRLELEGEAWRLADGGRATALSLGPGERQLVPVRVATGLARFEACRVGARFRTDPPAPPAAVAASPATAVAPVEKKPAPAPLVSGVARQVPLPDAWSYETFEPHFRMENGALYHGRPRTLATPTWRHSLDRLDDFTPAFYGRYPLPWRFADNRPASLVFIFHPKAFPAVFEIRHPEVKRFFAPAGAK